MRVVGSGEQPPASTSPVSASAAEGARRRRASAAIRSGRHRMAIATNHQPMAPRGDDVGVPPPSAGMFSTSRLSHASGATAPRMKKPKTRADAV